MFRLRTLGGATLERDGVALDTVGAQRKTLALLALLAVARGQGISRDRLAAFLWPDSDTERARGALKQALHVARRQLGSGEAIPGSAELRLNRSYIESDVDAFLGALEEGKPELAARLYGGPFLDGFHLPGAPEFEQWVAAQRDELAHRYASALERLASEAEARGDSEAAIAWLRRLQSTDPLSSRVTLRLMRAFDAAGERRAALRCAQVHELLLREELGSSPDPEVAALAQRLREETVQTERPRAAPSPPVVPAGADSETPAASEPVAAPSPAVPGGSIRRSHAAAALALLALLAIVLVIAVRREPSARNTAGPRGDPSVAVDDGSDVARPTSNPEAYELYLQARDGGWMLPTQERLERAVVYYQRATTLDPAFAEAYAGLAETYANLSNFGLLGPGEALARAGLNAERALELDPQLAEAHAAKAFVLASTQEFHAAEAAFRRALDLSPGYAWARHYYALLLLMLGRTDEAAEQNRQALAADANSYPAHATRGIILLQRGDYPAADRELERALALKPDYQLTQYYLGVLRAAQGRHGEAGWLLDQAAKGAPGSAGFTGVPGARALVLQRTGRGSAADSLLRDLEAQTEAGDERTRANLAFAYAALGRLDAAFGLFDHMQWDVPSLIELRADPLLHALRSDPRYPALLRRIGAGP